jgi:hypothetical protein
VRLQASDQSLTVLLFANYAWNWLGLAHAERFDLVFSNAFACQVGSNGSSTTLGKLLVVLLRAQAVGVTGHEHELKLLHFFDARNDFAIKNGLALRLQNGFVEVEQRFGSKRDLLNRWSGWLSGSRGSWFSGGGRSSRSWSSRLGGS